MTLLLNEEPPRKWRATMAWAEEHTTPRNNAGSRCLFRRVFDLAEVPTSFRVWVSADSRYKLFINGTLVGRGPLKGTLARYHAEEYDLASLLVPGRNTIAADVVWFGYNMPLSEEHSGFAGFLLQGPEADADTPAPVAINTPGEWRCWPDTGFRFDRTPYTSNAHLFLTGMEVLDGTRYPWGWEQPDFDDSHWSPAVVSVPLSAPGGNPDADLLWNFAPRDLPALVEEPRRFLRTLINAESGLVPAAYRFTDITEERVEWSLPANEGGRLILDAGALTTGYLSLVLSGGSGRTVEVVYSENLWHRNPEKPDDGTPLRWGGGGRLCKGVRTDLTGALIHGYQDTLTLNGQTITFEPHHWRTFWWIEIRVSPGETPFSLHDARYRFTTSLPGMPLATFTSSDPDTSRIWETSWRTLQLCSHETYEDCPGYEQLNYLFDARNEALTTLYMTGDTALPRRTIRLFGETLRWDGMLSSRTPSQLRQTIPIFALWWIIMVLDYYEWTGDGTNGQDRAFVRDCLIAVDGILAYFRERMQPDGFVGVLPYWNPIGGENAPNTDLDPAIAAGGSTYVTALYLYALNAGCRLHREVGFAEDAQRWTATKGRLHRAIGSAWNEARGVWVERLTHPDAPVSQHTQAMAILSGAAATNQIVRAAASIAANVPAARMTRQQGLPFAEAMYAAGRYELAWAQWHDECRMQLDLGLTTWLEGGAERRSDCHAWSAWQPIEYLRSVLGVRPVRPGWGEIEIAPLPLVSQATGSVPTPVGVVQVSFRAENGQIRDFTAQTPPGIPVQVCLPGQEVRSFTSGGTIDLTDHRENKE